MKNTLTTVISVIEAIGIGVLVRLYIMVKNDNKDKFNKLEGRVTSLEKTTITKDEFKELLKLHLRPITDHLECITNKLNSISETKIK